MDVVEKDFLEQENTTQHYELLQELGDCYCSVGDYEKAQSCYEKAASLGPDEAGPYVGLGVIALQKNLLDDAEISFKVACRLGPDCSRAYTGLGMVAQERKNYQQAFDMYLKSLELDTENMAALLGLFQTSCQMGSFSKVAHYLRSYLQMHPGDVSVMFSLAAIYIKDDQPERSREILFDILALDPDNKDAQNLLEEVEQCLCSTKQNNSEPEIVL